MKKKIERRECDECGAVKEQSEIMFGGSPFNGWLNVTRTDGSTVIPRRDNGPWDFCGEKCAITFLSRKEPKERKSDYPFIPLKELIMDTNK